MPMPIRLPRPAEPRSQFRHGVRQVLADLRAPAARARLPARPRARSDGARGGLADRRYSACRPGPGRDATGVRGGSVRCRGRRGNRTRNPGASPQQAGPTSATAPPSSDRRRRGVTGPEVVPAANPPLPLGPRDQPPAEPCGRVPEAMAATSACSAVRAPALAGSRASARRCASSAPARSPAWASVTPWKWVYSPEFAFRATDRPAASAAPA